MASVGNVDPYEAIARRQMYVKKDSFKMFIHAKDCITIDDLSARKGAPKRVMWRPPRDYIKQASGKVHGDRRGVMSKYLGSKVVIKNKCNGDIRYKATVPVGVNGDPHQIYSRPYVGEGTIKPSGTQKDLSRSRGKGRGKREKSYSKRMDQVTIDVSEKFLFAGDANLYTLYEEDVPGDDLLSPTYHAKAKGVMDFAIILPNSNQYTGGKYQDDLIVAEVIVVTRYIVSERGGGFEVTDIESVGAFHVAKLASMDALYHVDVAPLVTAVKGGSSTPGGPGFVTLPRLRGHDGLGIVTKNGKGVLYRYTHSGSLGEVFRWVTRERDFTRLCIPGLSYIKTQASTTVRGESEGATVADFMYIASEEAWVLVDGRGKPVTVGTNSTTIVSSLCPVIVYTTEEIRDITGGLIKHYGDGNAKAVSWQTIVVALTTTIRVLEFATRIASMFV